MSYLRLSAESPTALSIRAWCPKCMTHTFLYQPKPRTDVLLMMCESCGTTQDAYNTSLRTACVSESTRLRNNSKSKKKKRMN